MMSTGLGEIVMTDHFDHTQANVEVELLDDGPDLLARLMEDVIELAETDAPKAVQTTLFRYSRCHIVMSFGLLTNALDTKSKR